MDPNVIVQLVGSLGFPIVCCGALFWYINKTMRDFSKEMQDSIKSLTKSISDNTDATTRLVTTVEVLTKLGGDDNG